ncbi:putative CRM domain-containing protein, chloroplastic [Sesamum alatum]|uniref:CRM domain-containing protein, chloroplastic n=1 Tax=Sesamum alatum TaxID=300844 RepID=A0AAE2CXH6_9LAMI|nr:putative CRM domain-containing protein, chloroplastic [Sesamum alatum]
MRSASVSGLSSIMLSKTPINAITRRECPLRFEWLIRRTSKSACSTEATLLMRFMRHFGYGSQRKHHLEKFLPQLSHGSSLVNALSVKSSCMFAPQNVSTERGYARDTTNASIELKTDEDVIRFDIGDQSGKGGSLKKEKKTAKKDNISRKAKLNELRFYRLKAKKKMNSPNPEVRIRYKLEKAKRKEAWLIEKLRKYEVPKAPPETYDPEILTEEERFYLKRTGEKKKHYVPVGRRGVFGGVVLNMHLHWKKHETVKVICKPCKPGQVHQYAEELARLSKGIIIDVKPNNVIIFYRGKNYVQPDVMSPPDTLSKAKALEKYRYEQSLEHTSMFIEKLENELEEYHEHIARISTSPDLQKCITIDHRTCQQLRCFHELTLKKSAWPLAADSHIDTLMLIQADYLTKSCSSSSSSRVYSNPQRCFKQFVDLEMSEAFSWKTDIKVVEESDEIKVGAAYTSH